MCTYPQNLCLLEELRMSMTEETKLPIPRTSHPVYACPWTRKTFKYVGQMSRISISENVTYLVISGIEYLFTCDLLRLVISESGY